MNNEYIIINKTAIQKRIEELEKELQNLENLERKYRDKSWDEEYAILPKQIDLLKAILSQSTPLIPEIEKAFNASKITTGMNQRNQFAYKYKNSKDYISSLKLNI